MNAVGARVPTPDRATGEEAVAPSVAPASAVLAKAASENFTVAPWFVGRRLRRELNSLYGFARLVDDLGDESDGDRLASLDWAEAELHSAAVGAASHPVFRALTPTIRDHGLELRPFRDLIAANRLDQRVHTYATFDELVGYCELSANPVGRLVLAILGASTRERVRWSDDVCTALQIVEHLQDVREDAERGRVYLPSADLGAAGCPADDLIAASASEPLKRVIAIEADRARALFASAVPLAASLRGRARILICGFAAGGLAVLDALDAARHDVLANDVTPRKADVVRHTFKILTAALRADRSRGRS